VPVAVVADHSRRMRRIILSAVACTSVPYFSTLFYTKQEQKNFELQKLNIRTAIFHCIYTQLQTNLNNKINFTDIPLYFILQEQLYKDIIKLYLRVDIHIYTYIYIYIYITC